MRAQSRFIAGLLAVLGVLFSPSPAGAYEETEKTSDEIKAVMDQVAAMRRELADLKLQLRQKQDELALLKEFLATPDAQAKVAEWKKEREELAAEKQRLVVERKKLEQEQEQARRAAALAAKAPPKPTPEDLKKPRYQIDYKIATIPTDGTEVVYYDPEDGDVLVQRYPDVDRNNVLLRGTFQNLSTDTWRYTFEIRLADGLGKIIGRWRIQTPALSPNELHQFEVKVPVTDVAYIRRYQLGNIQPDQPKEGEKKEAEKKAEKKEDKRK